MVEDGQGVVPVVGAAAFDVNLKLDVRGLVTWRASFSRTHLRSAALLASRAAVLDPDASPVASDMGIERVACTTAAILTAVAAIEAAVSEVYVVAVEQQELAAASASPREKALAAQWETVEGKPTLDGKAKLALRVVGKGTSDLVCWEDITDLFKLRNILTHYTAGPIVGTSSTPDVFIHEGNKRLRDVEKSLSNNTKLKRGMSVDTPYFPFPYLNGSCATWAVELSCKFIDDFCALMGHPSPLAQGN